MEFLNEKTCKLTNEGYQEIEGDFLDILNNTTEDIDIVCAFHQKKN